MNPLCLVALLVLLVASCVERATGYHWPGLDDPLRTMGELGCDCCDDPTEAPPNPPRPPDEPAEPVEPIGPGDDAKEQR